MYLIDLNKSVNKSREPHTPHYDINGILCGPTCILSDFKCVHWWVIEKYSSFNGTVCDSMLIWWINRDDLYLRHTCVCMPQIFEAYSFNWGILSMPQISAANTRLVCRNICGIHEYDASIFLWEWKEWKNNVLQAFYLTLNIMWHITNRWRSQGFDITILV